MGFFSKKAKSGGWLATSFSKEGISAACITRGSVGLPKVTVFAFHAGSVAAWPASLEKLAKDLHASRYQCTTLLALGDYQLLSVEAPNVPPDELKTAIRWRLKDMLEFHVDDATIDVLDVPVDKNAPIRSRSMYAVAAHNQVIQKRQNLFAQAKLPLSVIDIPEMAQRNLAVFLEEEGRGLAMLSFNGDGGLLTISFGGELFLSRRVDVSFDLLDHTDLDQQKASFDRVTLELQRSLDHFDRQYHFITVSKLILAPMDRVGNSLQTYLAANLFVPVETMNLDTVLDLSDVPDLRLPENQRRYFLTLGAALRHEEKAL